MKRKRILMQPELEAIAGEWGPIVRLKAADTFEQWARELRVTAFMMCRSADDDPPSFASKKRRVRRGLQCPKVKEN